MEEINKDNINKDNLESQDDLNLEEPENKFDNNQDYEWDFEKYNQMDLSSKEKSNKNKGAVVFASIFGSLVAIPILAFGGIKLSQFLSDITTEKEGSVVENNIELKISSNKATISAGNKTKPVSVDPFYSNQPATQIAKKVIPSIVSVVPYIRQQSFYQTGITEAGNASGIIISKNGYIISKAYAGLKNFS